MGNPVDALDNIALFNQHFFERVTTERLAYKKIYRAFLNPLVTPSNNWQFPYYQKDS
jgi:hypothetical protein